ncbi:Snf7 family, partial [Trinorchestia longiramus]
STVEVRLEETCRVLEGRVEQLSDLRSLLQQQAKRSLNNGNRTQALSLLRRKRRVEASLQTHLGALENASSCCEQLRDSRINREVIAAFRNSALALKELLSGDTSPDSAAETMDQLQEVLDECKDVSESVSGPVGDQADSEELEAELDALMAEQESNREDDEVIRAL